MKSGTWALMSTITLFASMGTPVGRAAQEPQVPVEVANTLPTSTANPVPLINLPLVPDAVTPGGAGFTLTVNGTGFVSGSVVKWNGHARITTFVSASQLRATILASDIANASTTSVTVVNPTPGGGVSNVTFLEITHRATSLGLATPVIYGGDTFTSVVVADFNGDGKPDLAVSDSGVGVGVMLGNGDGTFQPEVTYNAGGGDTQSVAVGDFNGDGKLDLAVTYSCSTSSCTTGGVSIFLGKGDGTFQPAVNYAVNGSPSGLVVGDFKGDGRLDLALANESDNTVGVLLGNGDGTFQAEVTYPVGTGPTAIALDDFNRDGKLDLAVANSLGNTLSVLMGNGDGTFRAATSYTVGSNPGAVVAADFNGDGKLDLVAANSGSNNLSVLIGNGDGTFRSAVNYAAGSQPISLILADLNGDGKLDLVVGAGCGQSNPCTSATVSILLGSGLGSFETPLNYYAGVSPISGAAGDFNNDGGIDLALAGRYGVSSVSQIPTVSLSKTNLNFSNQLVGTSSGAETVTLTNTSGLKLAVGTIAVTGTNATDFRQTNTCNSGVLPGESCTIAVTWTPTQIGPRAASVTITDNAVGSPQSISLSGTGVVSGPNATVSATSLTFATQVVGTTSTAQPVILSDFGTTALAIKGIATTGDFHEANNCGSSLAAGASCTINVTFKPTQIDARSGTLSVSDNAPASPQNMRLSGEGTVLTVVPYKLGFFCHHGINGCPPPPQRITLANTRGTALTLSSITISGAYFSETNTCPLQLAAGATCTITVSFKPPALAHGTITGAVSIADNGGASPQQVSLTGTVTKNGASPQVLAALPVNRTATVPRPTANSQVGTRIMRLLDAGRDDPFGGNGAKRELLVRFWYPAFLDQDCRPAEYTSPKVWGYFSELLGTSLPEVTTNSCRNAPVLDAPHPVVVFTHGYTGTFTDYTFLFEDLASRGYVVVSIDHTYEATAVEFPDGRFIMSVMGSHFADTWHIDDQSLSFALSVRLEDVSFVLNELERLNTSSDNPFAGKLDLGKVALAGHSLGGLTTWQAVQQDTRFKVAILLDPYLAHASHGSTQTPVMMLAMGHEQRSEAECRLWSDLHGPRFYVNLRGAEHATPSDLVWLSKGTIKAGAMGPDKTIAAVRDYIAAFLDANLRGEPSVSLLRGPSSDYPEAAVTTRWEPLCSGGTGN